MKKSLIAAVLLLALCFAGCGNNSETNPVEATSDTDTLEATVSGDSSLQNEMSSDVNLLEESASNDISLENEKVVGKWKIFMITSKNDTHWTSGDIYFHEDGTLNINCKELPLITYSGTWTVGDNDKYDDIRNLQQAYDIKLTDSSQSSWALLCKFSDGSGDELFVNIGQYTVAANHDTLESD